MNYLRFPSAMMPCRRRWPQDKVLFPAPLPAWRRQERMGSPRFLGAPLPWGYSRPTYRPTLSHPHLGKHPLVKGLFVWRLSPLPRG